MEMAAPYKVEQSLARLSASLAASRVGTVLVVGSSSTVGIGASSPRHTYVARLEVNLEQALQALISASSAGVCRERSRKALPIA